MTRKSSQNKDSTSKCQFVNKSFELVLGILWAMPFVIHQSLPKRELENVFLRCEMNKYDLNVRVRYALRYYVTSAPNGHFVP